MSSKEDFGVKLTKLVEQFHKNEEYYKSKAYKEDELRQEFINPFFKSLGWDMDNESGVAPQYRDVVHEDRIEIEGKPKAPDYSFKVGAERKFFVEAKAASVKIISEFPPSFQLRRYAWSGKLPVSILTDFEELSIYDTTIEPKQSDKTETARIKYIHYKDYPKEVDYLWDTFSKNAVWHGSFDKFAKATKRGNQLVDKSFLAEIETWRSLLAKDIANNNENINIYDLNDCVQKIIDRIIFLRIAEDRGIELYENLKRIIDSKDSYGDLIKIFKRAHDKYNSNLFDFDSDKLTPSLSISDKVLDRIIGSLYYPKSPFEFSVIGVEILGSVYEQFLGKVIRLTKSHNAIIEEKPEVKKAGGVYYTPQYIVDYIVKNTVGELVQGKTPKDVAKLKIVDPACGSGSFLIGAYNFLLDWHLKYYTEHDLSKNLKSKKIFEDSDGNYLLSSAEKKQILINNIYGVDIDAQAVEVTKLSLALKMLENENSETINAQLKLFADRILPDLGSNIKCGNSLIGSDYYTDKNISLLGDEEIRKVNAFDWEKEFPNVFPSTGSGSGFDAVIGNPPYIRIQGLQEFAKEQVPFLKQKYLSASQGNVDIYAMFLELSLKLINKSGKVGFILPHKFFQADFAKNIRQIISNKNAIEKIVNFREKQIFENASTYTCLFFMSGSPQLKFKYAQIDDHSPQEFLHSDSFESLDSTLLSNEMWNFANSQTAKILEKINRVQTKLGDITEKIFQGIATSADKIYVLQIISETKDTYKCFSKQLNCEIEIEKGLVKLFLMGKDVHRYEPVIAKNVVIFPYLIKDNKAELMSEKYIRENFPLGYEYLKLNKKALEERERGRMKRPDYYAYIYPKNLTNFESKRIITPEISLGTNMSISEKGIYHTTKVYSFLFKKNLLEDEKYLLGLLNSKLLWIFLSNTGYVLRGGYFTFKTNYLKPFPIRLINFDNQIEKSKHDKIVQFVSNQLETQKQLHSENITDSQKKLLEQRAENLDKQIDELVYELYGLTKEEIKIVEGSLRAK